MPTYPELKSELIVIADILKQYPESLQSRVFDILTSNLGVNAGAMGRTKEVAAESKSALEFDGSPSSPKRKSVSKESYAIVKDLNLRGNDKTMSFGDFYKQKQPKSGIEFNVLSIYYTSRMLQIPNVTIDHIYTCYKEVSRPLPEKLRQSLLDTSSNKYGYISIENGSLIVTTRGENLIEHDLPKNNSKTVESAPTE